MSRDVEPEPWTPEPRWVGALAAAAVVLVGVGTLFSGVPGAIATIIVALGATLGLRRGAARTLPALLGLLFAAILAGPVGRAIEQPLAGVTGLGGLAARGAAAALAGIVLTAAVWIPAAVALAKLRSHDLWRTWQPWDHWAGAAIGAAECALLALLACWGLRILGPVQTIQSGAGSAPGLLARSAASLGRTPLGRLADATSPVASSSLLALLDDFVAVARDPEAMASFLESDTMTRVRALPSVQDALRRLGDDPGLKGLGEGTTPLDADAVLRVLQSPAVLDVLDHTTIASDLAGEGEAMREALHRARALVR